MVFQAQFVAWPAQSGSMVRKNASRPCAGGAAQQSPAHTHTLEAAASQALTPGLPQRSCLPSAWGAAVE